MAASQRSNDTEEDMEFTIPEDFKRVNLGIARETLTGLPEPEYIFGKELDTEEFKSFSNKLTYGVGYCYLGGLAIGGFAGMVRGLHHGFRSGASLRVRIWAFTHHLGQTSAKVANTIGSGVLIFVLTDALLGRYVPMPDYLRHTSAGIAAVTPMILALNQPWTVKLGLAALSTGTILGSSYIYNKHLQNKL